MGAIAFQITSLNRLFRRRSKNTSKLNVTGLYAGSSPATVQITSNVENVSIWLRHHVQIFIETIAELSFQA